MTRIITDAEYDELWEEALEKGDVIRHSDGFDTIFKWKHEFAEQYYRKIQLPLGLRINIFEDESQAPWRRKEQHSECHPPTLAFQLNGSYQVLTASLKDDYYSEKAGQNYLFFTPGTQETEEYPSQERLLRARIRLYPRVLRALSEGQIDSLLAAKADD